MLNTITKNKISVYSKKDDAQVFFDDELTEEDIEDIEDARKDFKKGLSLSFEYIKNKYATK